MALPTLGAALYAGVVLVSLGDERFAEEALIMGGTVLLFVSAYFVRARPGGVMVGGAIATAIVLAAAWRVESEHAPGEVVRARLMADGVWLALAFVVSAQVARRLAALRRERDRLRRYRLKWRLGGGAVCDVFEADHPILGTRVAVAIARRLPDRSRPLFSRALEAAARLDHPALVRVFEHGVSEEGTPFCVMELVEGVSLARAVELLGPMPPGRVIHLMRQACSALACIHHRGLVHRDLKPENVFLLREGFDGVKVMDLDLLTPAARGGQEASLASPGFAEGGMERVFGSCLEVGGSDATVRGTPLYLAPEAILDPQGIDARADVYALAAVAYYLLTGEAPLSARSAADAIEHQLHRLPSRPSVRHSTRADDLEELLLQCLAKRPESRPADAAALGERLAACADADSWTFGEARAWWRAHAALLDRTKGEIVDDALVVPRA